MNCTEHSRKQRFEIAPTEKKVAIWTEINPRLLTANAKPQIAQIIARVTRNIKEDPSIEGSDVWNVETVLLEKLPDKDVRLIADPKEIGAEQIPGSKLDSTGSILTIRNQSRSPLREGDTIQVEVR